MFTIFPACGHAYPLGGDAVERRRTPGVQGALLRGYVTRQEVTDRLQIARGRVMLGRGMLGQVFSLSGTVQTQRRLENGTASFKYSLDFRCQTQAPVAAHQTLIETLN